jgi:hypothetical protein
MGKKWLSLLSALLLAVFLVTPAAARSLSFDALQPGEQVTFKQTIPINLAFIGYDKLDRDDLLNELPATYEPLVRVPQYYGLSGRPMGLHYDFKYRFTKADKAFENQFFGYLREIGQPNDLTAFQQQYNDQQNNILDVTGPVLYIDAPSVEQWLARKGREAFDIDPRSYTIYFVNWYSRKDFKFHVYTKTDEPDPDTGYNFGEIRTDRDLIAWGGTETRTWFFDPSAGPESWSGSWNVDDQDLDGDDVPDYRIPPIWEYAEDGYRRPSKLSSDLGLVTRYVGINLLFTNSPLYDPLVTTPGLGGDKVVHIEVLQDDPATDGRDYLDADLIRSKLRALQPYYGWEVNVEQTKPLDPGARRAFRIFAGLRQEDDCWNVFGDTFAELFCYFNENLDTYVPPYDPNDYVVEVFAFNTTNARMGDPPCCLGYADDNWVDGTQTFVFEFDWPDARAGGYGFSTTTIHEVGHHIGLSHPHDGYDAESGVDYAPTGDFYFAWSGDESNTIMSYIDLNWDFGQFDQDNIYRWETAGYLNQANNLLDDILAEDDAGKFEDRLQQADRYAQQAQHDFDQWNYLSAVRNAYRAYSIVAAVAAELGIDSSTHAPSIQAAPNPNVPRQVDPIR